MTIATLDIGTNTVLLLIVRSNAVGSYEAVRDVHAIARLGEGIDASHRISDAAVERFRTVMASHRKVLDEVGVDCIAAVATSAMRDAENRDEVIALIKNEFGIQIELLSGDEEAEWTYRGSLTGVPGLDFAQRIGTLDIGGGSTEISFGDGQHSEFRTSLDVGAVRLTERVRSSALPRFDAISEQRQLLSAQLQSITEQAVVPKQLVAVAGTPTSLATMKLGAASFRAKEIDGLRITREEIDVYFDEMLGLAADDLCARYPGVNPARADILPMGTLILSTVMQSLDIPEIIVSTKGLRYGIAIREMENRYASTPMNWTLTSR